MTRDEVPTVQESFLPHYFYTIVFKCLFGGIANQVRNKKFCMSEFK